MASPLFRTFGLLLPFGERVEEGDDGISRLLEKTERTGHDIGGLVGLGKKVEGDESDYGPRENLLDIPAHRTSPFLNSSTNATAKLGMVHTATTMAARCQSRSQRWRLWISPPT